MINYVVIKRRNPATKAVKYYGRTAGGSKPVSQQKLVEEIAEQSSLTTGDVKNCLDRLEFVIKQHLLEGRSVKLDDLGIFSVQLHTLGTDTEKLFKADMIKRLLVRFLPSSRLKDALRVGRQDVSFNNVTPKAEEAADK